MGGNPKVTATSTAGTSGNWFEDLFLPFMTGKKDRVTVSTVGDVWSSTAAEDAFRRGEMNSRDDAGASLRVAFRNTSKHPLILSWLDSHGKCHHFYTLKPAEIVEGPVNALDHTENTSVGHSFCIAHVGSKSKEEKIRESKYIDPKYVIGGFRALTVPTQSQNEPTKNGEKSKYVHLVTISQQSMRNPFCCVGAPQSSASLRSNKGMNGSTDPDDDMLDEESGNNFDDLRWVVEAKESIVDETQIDTSKKEYTKTVLGGWPVYCEPNWHDGDMELEKRLAAELEYASKCLPPHARETLRETTPVWINKSLQWGPVVCPINGRGLCFHPEADFLKENAMTVEKANCVELYNAKQYFTDDSHLWGVGGVFVHEFSHAYHHKILEKGYENPEIKECFEKAMDEKLYDWVRVHGRQGPMNKAYACMNAMEYFAELSAAFLGQPDMHSTEEYNKWYPFNRRHVKEHDPRAYEVLKKLWKVSDD